MPKKAVGFVHGPDYVQSLARGLQVLRGFDAEHSNPTLADIAARTRLSRAAVRRLVLTLQHLGYLRAEGRGYAITPRVLELGFGYLGSLNFTDTVQPMLESLALKVNRSCSMAVLDAQSIVYIARVPVRRVMSAALGIGARLPAFVASMGRVLLSGLSDADLRTWLSQCETRKLTAHTVTDPRKLRRLVEDVRESQYAYVEQELELGLCSIAVPVHNKIGRIAAALNVSLPYHEHVAREATETMLPKLRDTAKAIERCLPTQGMASVSL
ncbi:MAG TPA: IclR family transcriptional regulator C-terminal domain-containing protein [Xanthomonadaceae bacterium]|jgi:IclR family pca regulon transcriptional regulator|nr:IclR family transcriptional regulator C-terminal domain-containing protein [Xanthomonadaceae bacterium]